MGYPVSSLYFSEYITLKVKKGRVIARIKYVNPLYSVI